MLYYTALEKFITNVTGSERMELLHPKVRRDIWILVGATLACYVPALFNGFVNYDDPTLLFENSLIQKFSLENTVRIFSEIVHGHYSRFNPLVFVTYMIVHHLTGFNAFWFHAMSLFFHLGAVVAVYVLVIEITHNTRLGLICALLYAVHPIHVEPVAWASALTHVMYTFFYLCSALFFCIGLNNRERRVTWFIFSYLFFGITGACFSGGAITLPLVLTLFMLFERGAPVKKAVFWLVPFFVLSGYFAYLTIYSAKSADVITNPYFNIGQYPLFERVNLSVISLLVYVKQTIFPYSYSLVYPEGYFFPLGNGWVTIAFAVFTVLVAAGRERFFRLKYFKLGFLFFLITIAPFLKIYSTSDSITNDRYVYLASFGLFLIMAEIIDQWLATAGPSRRTARIILSAGLCYLIITTWTTCANWRNSEMLWSQVIKIYPQAYPAYTGRANYYYGQREYSKALADCDKALSYNPKYTNALSLKGLVFMTAGLYGDAIKMYSHVLEQEPEQIHALNNRGAAYLLLGQADKAIADFNQSLGLETDQTDIYYNRGIAYGQTKQWAAAIRDLKHVLSEKPDFQPAKEKMDEIEVILREQ